ncbi:MAG: ribonuclease HI [Blastocatellia bacterium]
MKNVVIVCDGSSLGNGKDSARAAAVAVLGFNGLWKAFGEYLGRATNQQAEIAAAALGLERLKEPCDVLILSDSRYVVETMSSGWKRRANQNWWSRLDAALDTHRIEWRWIKGHSGHIVQEIADRAARKIAETGKVDKRLLEEVAAGIGTVEIS